VSSFSTFLSFPTPGTDSNNTYYFFSPANTNASNGSINVGSNYQAPYVQPADTTYAYPNFMVVPSGCTVKALNVAVFNYYNNINDTTTISLFHSTTTSGLNSAVPGSPAMTCSVATAGSAGTCTDTSSFDVSAGDLLSVGFKETNNTAYNTVTIGVVCQ
jgi:hypothetical protein